MIRRQGNFEIDGCVPSTCKFTFELVVPADVLIEFLLDSRLVQPKSRDARNSNDAPWF